VIRLEWFIVAEGIGQDAKAAYTLIGVNQNALVTSDLPVYTKRAFLVHMVEDEGYLKEGDEVGAAFRIASPTGEAVAEGAANFTVGPRRFKKLPAELDIPVELGFEIREHGTYQCSVEVTTPGASPLGKALSLYVLDPSVLSSIEVPAAEPDEGTVEGGESGQ
jgi:hypothetical protein